MEIGNWMIEKFEDGWNATHTVWGPESFETRPEAVAYAREQHAEEIAEERAEAEETEAEAIRDDIRDIIDSADLATLRRILKMMKK
jgi:hypothetical protein